MVCCGRGLAVDLSAEVGDLDHYAAAPDTLAVVAASSDSLARVVGGDIFGHYWSSFGGNGQITAIDGVSMTGRADGVQELATATYSTFKGVEAAINSSGSSLEGILTNILRQLEKDDNPNFDNLYSRLVALYDQQAELASDNRIFWNDFWKQYTNRTLAFMTAAGDSRVGLAVPDLLAGLSQHLYKISVIFGTSWLDSDGRDGKGNISLSNALGRGFVGFATLLSGADSHRGNWVWLNQSGYEGNGNTSLMDMVGEGFLGLGSFFADTTPGTGVARLVWDYLSFNDGVSSTKMQHSTLFGFLGQLGSGIQNPLARLAYVYASPDDIAFKKAEEPNMDQVKDSFFGDGEAAVNPDQIKDAAGISSAAKDAFGGAGSPGDAFTAINDSQSFWFFSQEVADALDTVNAAAPVSEEEDNFMDQFVQDDDGFYSLIDLSPWDVSSYLGGER